MTGIKRRLQNAFCVNTMLYKAFLKGAQKLIPQVPEVKI